MNSGFFRFPLNASSGGAPPPPPPPPLPLPSAPATPFYPSDVEFDAESAAVCFKLDQAAYAELLGHFRQIVQALGVICMATSACLVTVAIVLIFTVKRLQLMIGVMRTETRTEGVRAGLLEESVAAADAAKNGGGGKSSGGGGGSKSRKPRTDVNNTSCGLHDIDEEEDHRL